MGTAFEYREKEGRDERVGWLKRDLYMRMGRSRKECCRYVSRVG